MTATVSMTQDKLESALVRLYNGVKEITDGDSFKAWLTNMSKFHQYSPNNVMLIMLQNPEATRVAGFNTWKSMGRFVRKGEKGLTILAPTMFRYEKERADGTMEMQSRLGGFHIVSVFDVSQTDGKELPEPPRPTMLTEDAPELATLWERLLGFNKVQGVPVILSGLEDHTDSTQGYYEPARRQIGIRGTNPLMQKVKTLVHETAHSLSIPDTLTAAFANRGIEELIAESTAFLVLDHYGIDTTQYSAPYMAGWSGGETETVLKLMTQIKKFAGEIISGIGELG